MENENNLQTVKKTQTEKNIEKGEKYLPIGTVALLKGGTKRVMITGFCAAGKNKPDEIWDYSGCIYPEGIVSSNSVLLFDHSQITKIYHMGFVDEEEKRFKEKLKGLLNTEK